ncbi:DnaB-like helicase N-terminal domain-containing protein [Streptomyces amakusaensis]|uniref:DnaB-like helicase N-terminal domain-containing protein n=1 Tax=Streptomyces amakusaensis TaxID=67271 RepID=A0ABW0ALN3_9ACTN
MPGTTDPYGDESAAPAPSPPVYYAEQALLGALLLTPERLKRIGVLEAGHFGDPAHAALFAAMGAVSPPNAAVHVKEPVWLTTVLDRARCQARGLTASYLHTLIHVCPDPAHAPAYAQIVRSEHARRTLRSHAGHLARVAGDPGLPNPAATVLNRADVLARYLDRLAGEFAPHPGSLPRTPLSPERQKEATEEVLDEERLLLAVATAHPDELAGMRWLQPDDFALPLHGQLYRCLTLLDRRGAVVDPVTVLWEAQQHGLTAQGADPGDLLALLSAHAGSTEHWGRRILQRALLHQARTTAETIHTLADDPANSVHQLVTGSRRSLADLTAIRTRWRPPITPQPPARSRAPRTTAAVRAGPPRTTAPGSPVRTSR